MGEVIDCVDVQLPVVFEGGVARKSYRPKGLENEIRGGHCPFGRHNDCNACVNTWLEMRDAFPTEYTPWGINYHKPNVHIYNYADRATNISLCFFFFVFSLIATCCAFWCCCLLLSVPSWIEHKTLNWLYRTIHHCNVCWPSLLPFSFFFFASFDYIYTTNRLELYLSLFLFLLFYHG